MAPSCMHRRSSTSWNIPLLVLGLALVVACSPAQAPATQVPAEGWLTNAHIAFEKARKQHVPVLADFTGSDWCPACMKLHREVFDTPAFKSWAPDHVILLTVDFPNAPQAASLQQQNQELYQKYSITGFPTVLILDADGKVLGKSGYASGGPDSWIKHVSTMLPAAH